MGGIADLQAGQFPGADGIDLVLVIVGLDRGEGHRGGVGTGIDIDILGGNRRCL